MPPQYVVGIPSDESHYDSILPKRLLRNFKMSIGLKETRCIFSLSIMFVEIDKI